MATSPTTGADQHLLKEQMRSPLEQTVSPALLDPDLDRPAGGPGRSR